MYIRSVILISIILGICCAVDPASDDVQEMCFPLFDIELPTEYPEEVTTEVTEIETETEPITDPEIEINSTTLSSVNSSINESDLIIHKRQTRDTLVGKQSTIYYSFQLKSPGYPNPYPSNYYHNCSIYFENVTMIAIEIIELDIEGESDYLLIRAGDDEDSSSTPHVFHGQNLSNEMNKFYVLNKQSVFFEFISQSENADSKGFIIQITGISDTENPITPPPEIVTEPPPVPDVIEIIVEVADANKTNETWINFKDMLADATNQYLLYNEMDLPAAHQDNVTIVWVRGCPNSWPGYINCVRIEFGVRLIASTEKDYELNEAHLYEMWETYGKELFRAHGYDEFNLPDNGRALLIWTLVSVAIVAAFLIVLYAIWKQDFFQDYSLMPSHHDDKVKILKNQEIDISLFPTTHQIVPTFFPNEQFGQNNETGIHDYNPRPIKFTLADFPAHERTPLPPDHLDQFLQHTRPPSDCNTHINNFNEPLRPSQAFYPDDFASLPSTPSSVHKDKIILRETNKDESMS